MIKPECSVSCSCYDFYFYSQLVHTLKVQLVFQKVILGPGVLGGVRVVDQVIRAVDGQRLCGFVRKRRTP